MGYNTTVLILNDALPEIGRDEHFGNTLTKAVQEQFIAHKPLSIGSRGHANAATIIEQHRADETSLIAVGGNCATEFGLFSGSTHHTQEDRVRILHDLASRLGYYVASSSVAERVKRAAEVYRQAMKEIRAMGVTINVGKDDLAMQITADDAVWSCVADGQRKKETALSGG